MLAGFLAIFFMNILDWIYWSPFATTSVVAFSKLGVISSFELLLNGDFGSGS